jgi:hypothetical protein
LSDNIAVCAEKRKEKEKYGSARFFKLKFTRLWFPVSLVIPSLVLFFVVMSNYTPDSVSGVPTIDGGARAKAFFIAVGLLSVPRRNCYFCRLFCYPIF